MAADAEAIAELMGVLGYPARGEEILDRLGRLDAHEHAVILVAELDGDVVGAVTGHVFPSIHSTPIVAWLTTLTVSDKHHRKGIGARLTAALEAWASQKGAVRVSLTSGLHRAGAHLFYEHLGYQRTGVRLTKTLVG